ncbi:MAG: winged helix-turn-helix transcriptional regulator [Thermoplasmatota archaeon]
MRNQARARIVSLIEADPGIHFRGLAAVVGLGNGALGHHLRVLAAGGLIVDKADGREVRYYMKQPRTFGLEGRRSVLKSDTAQEIVAFVRTHPGLSIAGVGRCLSVNRSQVSRHARKLGKAGVLRLERMGRGVRLFPAEGRARALSQPKSKDSTVQ